MKQTAGDRILKVIVETCELTDAEKCVQRGFFLTKHAPGKRVPAITVCAFKKADCIFVRFLFCKVFQIAGGGRREADRVMIVHQSKSRADGKRAAGKGCECLPDAKRRLYNIIPCAK